jgi:hypothetical protein
MILQQLGQKSWHYHLVDTAGGGPHPFVGLAGSGGLLFEVAAITGYDIAFLLSPGSAPASWMAAILLRAGT